VRAKYDIDFMLVYARHVFLGEINGNCI
jgi:hypothetical protein